MPKAPVELLILGHTELTTPGERTGGFVLRQPKRLALLAYLALATAGGHRRRDQITALFWPDLDQPHARVQLRKVLHALRSTLGPEAIAARGEEEIRLDAERVWCDAVAFQAAVAAGRWTEALSLYRGDLLEGLYPGGVDQGFQDWLDGQRRALRDQAARAAWECSAIEDLAGRRHEAMLLARRAVDLNAEDEDGVRRLIAVLDRYGDRAGALQVFEEWQERLLEEYGAEPAPETRWLARKVQEERKGASLDTPSFLAAPAASRVLPRQPAAPESDAPQPAAPHWRWPRRRRSTIAVGALLVLVLSAVAAKGLLDEDRGAGAIAVLPLRGLGDAADARVGEGLAEELTALLVQSEHWIVRSTARSRAVAERGDDVRRLGRRLDVAYLFDGSVQHDAVRWRLAVRLVSIADGRTLWARSYDAEPADLMGAQERIAHAVLAEADSILERLRPVQGR